MESRSRPALAATACLVVFIGLVALVLPWHEPWFDEAQAWLLARDASLPELFWQRLRYEGSPGLWHLLLVLPARLGAPYFSLNLLSATLGAVTAGLFFFRSPFPWPLRAALPFTYYFFYQYCVVARSYALLGVLLFFVAVQYPRRLERSWFYALSLGLLAHVSLHAMLISGGLFLEWLHAHARVGRLRQAVRPSALLVGNFLLIVAQLWSPPDLYGPTWKLQPYDILTNTATMLGDSLSPQRGLSAVALLLALAYFRLRRRLAVYLLCALPVLALLVLKFANVWHEGILFELLVFGYWLSLASEVRPASSRAVWLERTALAALAVLCATQIYWSVAAARHEIQLPYSGSRAAAEYLQAHRLDRETIHCFKFSTFALLPYFQRNIFANTRGHAPGSYWIWTQANMAGQTPQAIVHGHPRYLLLGALLPSLDDRQPPPIPGYTLEQAFRGRIIWKDGFRETDSYFLCRRIGD